MSSTEYLYGINPAFEVVRAGRRKVERACISSRGAGAKGRFGTLVCLLDRMKIPVELTDKGRLFQLCSSAEHQGVVLQTGPYPYVSFDSVVGGSRLLLLDNIEDPRNAGAILRSAEVFGWRDVLMSSKGTPEIYPSVVKSSAGATEHLRIARGHSAARYCRLLAEAGYRIIALDAQGRETFENVEMGSIEKAVLVIGGEHKSVGQYILNNSDHVVRIPERGSIRSLNASVAAGIALFEMGRQEVGS